MKTRAILALGIFTPLMFLSLTIVTVVWGETPGPAPLMEATPDGTTIYLPLIFRNWPLVQRTDFLVNGNFETANNNSDTGLANWSAWWLEDNCQGDEQLNYACRPNAFYKESMPGGRAFIYTGEGSLTIRNSWDPWVAGAKQTVSAPVGARVCLTAFGHLWAAGQSWAPNVPSDPWFAAVSTVGLDRNGADYPTSSSQVVWSSGASPHNTWKPFSVETTVGASGRVTAILRTSYRGYSANFMTASWDDASLMLGSCADNPPPPPPPPLYYSHGLVGYSFKVENPNAAVDDQVWFDFEVANTSNVTVAYSALAAHTDVGYSAWSWTMQRLKPGETLLWRDNLRFDQAGVYPLYLGICYAGSVEACRTAAWDRLSPNVSVVIR
jgi:hypothetical protein